MAELVRDKEHADELIAALSSFYGERVARASDHCSALLEWVRVMHESGYAPQVQDAWNSIQLTLLKSNLAARLVYGGEPVRTEPCPIHHGQWSGCTWGAGACPEGCMHGSNVTGWLAEPHEFVERPALTEDEATFYPDGFDPMTRCRKRGGLKEAGVHAAA